MELFTGLKGEGILLVVLLFLSVVEAEGVCTDYDDFHSAFYSCKNYSMPEYTQARLTLETLQYMCSHKSTIRSCMEKTIKHCGNVKSLLSFVDTTLNYCDGENVPLAIETFLKDNIDFNLTYDCLDTMYDRLYRGECDTSIRPYYRSRNKDVPEKVAYWKQFFDWHIGCFMESDLTEALPVCGHCMSRRKAYGIMIANIQATFGLGINAYPMFERFMRSE